MSGMHTSISAHPLFKKVVNFIHRYNILSNILHIDIALSGGADSVCLAAILSTLIRTKYNEITLRSHHIRHGLRNDAHDADIARSISHLLSVDFIRTDLNLGRIGRNVESVARNARYDALFNALSEKRAPAIALAHHGDENVETAIWRLGRGCGSEGLCMPPVRAAGNIRLIRPLLDCAKSEIYGFLRDLGLEWAEDPTNQNDAYKRNFIRHDILPNILHVSTSPSACYHSLLNIAQDAEAVCNFSEQYAKSHKVFDRTFYISRNDWNDLQSGAQSQVLRHIARHIMPHACPTHEWVTGACTAMRNYAQTHRVCQCGEMAIFCSQRGFCITNTKISHHWHDIGLNAEFYSSVDVAGLGMLTAFRATPATGLPNTTQFAAFCLPDAAMRRLRLTPAAVFKTLTTSDGRTTKTREALRSQGIPAPIRGIWPVLCDGNAPLWVLGGMRTENAPKAIPGEMALCLRWMPRCTF